MVLEVKGLQKEFRREGETFYAVKDADLKLTEGDFFSIIGKSGSGKSTLLNLIAGLLSPTKGELWLDGKNILGLKDREASLLRNSCFGYIAQGQSALANLTVLENVKLPHYFFHRQEDATERAMELLSQTGIAHLANSYPRKLSGGELKRVAIARALMNRPSVLLADEPTSDLDTENTKGVMELFRTIAKQGTAILFVTHDLDATGYGSAVYRMESGILGRESESVV